MRPGHDPAIAQAPPADMEFGYLDQVHGSYVIAQWNPAHSEFAGFVLGCHRPGPEP